MSEIKDSEKDLGRPDITDAIIARKQNFGTPDKWFIDKLDIAYNTYLARMQYHNWKEVEILALKHLGVVE